MASQNPLKKKIIKFKHDQIHTLPSWYHHTKKKKIKYFQFKHKKHSNYENEKRFMSKKIIIRVYRLKKLAYNIMNMHEIHLQIKIIKCGFNFLPSLYMIYKMFVYLKL